MNEETKKLLFEQANSAEVAQLSNYGSYFHGTLAIIFGTMLIIGMSIMNTLIKNCQSLTVDEVISRTALSLVCIVIGLIGLIISLHCHFYYFYLPGSAL